MEWDEGVRAVTKGHIGWHPTVLHRVVEHPDFRNALRPVAREWLWRVRARPFCVAVYCHRGETRSVAMAYILEAVFRRLGATAAQPTCHLSSWYWRFNTCSGRGCQVCAGPSDGRHRSMDSALRIFKDVLAEEAQ